MNDKGKHFPQIRSLKQALKHAVKLEKVDRVMEFSQKEWLTKGQTYIVLYVKLRKNAKNRFEKDFYKQINNLVLDKVMKSYGALL